MNKILNVGFIGWRGMVGSVLLQRMMQEEDFTRINPVFFSTSNVGGDSPNIGRVLPKLVDAYALEKLVDLDVIITTHGSDYSQNILPQLRKSGFNGYWLDASSYLRMEPDSVIVLDPVNYQHIKQALNDGIKTYCGANCTVSLMLMALGGLTELGLVEWITSSTYQAASGAGASHMKELLLQNKWLSANISEAIISANADILQADEQVSAILRDFNFPKEQFGAPLIGNVLPFIDSLMNNGQTREEWKAQAEANKIIGLTPDMLKIDGVCVRVGSMRCHSQALTVKLTNKNLTIETIARLITKHNSWVKLVPNNKVDTLKYLTPVAVSGTLDIAVGRLRKLSLGGEYLSLFTVGDQLLWGAAEPLRRMLNILVEYHS